MRRSVYLVMLLCLMLCTFIVSANALDQTSTGFYYPIGESNFDPAKGWWLSKDPNYLPGYYHIGVDMMTRTSNSGSEDSHVYAIADGVIVDIDQGSDWGTTNNVNNYIVFVQHKTKNGDYFIGYYGHLQLANGISNGVRVNAGQYIGYTGDYDNGVHLHFGIRKGTSISPSPWGRMPLSSWPNQNGFEDPIAFIKNNFPGTDKFRRVANVAWSPPNRSCYYADRWVFYSQGYPNGAQSIGGFICQQEEHEMMMSLGGIFSNWWNIFYSPSDIVETESCNP